MKTFAAHFTGFTLYFTLLFSSEHSEDVRCALIRTCEFSSYSRYSILIEYSNRVFDSEDTLYSNLVEINRL